MEFAGLPPTLQERANLAEQTLQQRQAMMAEKERFQSDVQHFSQVGAGRQGDKQMTAR